MADSENAMDVFFQKYASNKTKLDAMRTEHNTGGLSGLLLESPLNLGMNVAEGLASYGTRLGKGAVNGALAWGYDLSAAKRLKDGKDSEAAQYAAAADFLRGSAYRNVPGKPSEKKETKIDDGSGGDGKTLGYDEIMKRLDAMDASLRASNPAPYQHPTNQPAPSPIRTSSTQQTPANAVPAYLSQIGGFLSQFGGDDLAYAQRLVDYEAVRMGSLEKFGQSLAKPAVLKGTIDHVKNRSYTQL